MSLPPPPPPDKARGVIGTRKPARLQRVIAGLIPMLLAGCHPGVLDPAGPVAAGERTILLNSLAIMLAIVVPVIVLTLGFAWWFRAGNERADYRPDWTFSGRLELLVWSIPLLVVIFLAGIAWIGSHELDPARPLQSKTPPLEVQVVAMDWKWLFIYPGQGVASVNRLVLPTGTPIRFRITSATVMNSFFVPQLGGQVYAMAGMEAKLNLQADRPGRFRGLSAHYSGAHFGDMAFPVDAMPPAAFAQWVGATRSSPLVLDDRSYMTLLNRLDASPQLSFGRVAPNLFTAALRQSARPPREPVEAGREQE